MDARRPRADLLALLGAPRPGPTGQITEVGFAFLPWLAGAVGFLGEAAAGAGVLIAVQEIYHAATSDDPPEPIAEHELTAYRSWVEGSRLAAKRRLTGPRWQAANVMAAQTREALPLATPEQAAELVRALDLAYADLYRAESQARVGLGSADLTAEMSAPPAGPWPAAEAEPAGPSIGLVAAGAAGVLLLGWLLLRN